MIKHQDHWQRWQQAEIWHFPSKMWHAWAIGSLAQLLPISICQCTWTARLKNSCSRLWSHIYSCINTGTDFCYAWWQSFRSEGLFSLGRDCKVWHVCEIQPHREELPELIPFHLWCWVWPRKMLGKRYTGTAPLNQASKYMLCWAPQGVLGTMTAGVVGMALCKQADQEWWVTVKVRMVTVRHIVQGRGREVARTQTQRLK